MRETRWLAVVLLAVVAVTVTGCGGSSWPAAPATVQDITGTELEALLDAGNPPVVLDVRSAAEYAAGHIPASLNIPLADLSARLNELDSNAPTACVCAGGSRSAQAALVLVNAGFRTVYNLEGGLAEYDGPMTP